MLKSYEIETLADEINEAISQNAVFKNLMHNYYNKPVDKYFKLWLLKQPKASDEINDLYEKMLTISDKRNKNRFFVNTMHDFTTKWIAIWSKSKEFKPVK